MTKRYLAFDLETAKDIPGEDFNWRPHRPLGIACAATLASDSNTPQLWFSKARNGSPAKRMTKPDARELVDHLAKMAADGYVIVTWNGLGFDFDILSEEADAHANCKTCALDHVDMMFHLVCSLGYPVSLDKAAEGMGLPGKQSGMTGLLAPKLWAKGQFQKVLDYVAQDVRINLGLAQTCDRKRQFHWITQKGLKKSIPLSKGWLTVRQALKLPYPDTSWMTKPLSRQDFCSWLAAN